MSKLTASQIMEIENKHTSGLYGKQPIIFVRGQGAALFDIDGVEYLDCAAGHGVANLGHAHPKVAAAIAEQAGTLITLFETFYNEKRALLMDKMTSIIPGLDRVFFCNSGTESVEAALKVGRICTERGALLIADEIQSGFGRTGKLFAIQHSGVTPDLLCCAKSLAGGLPMGAVLIGPAVQNLVPGVHGSTFGGNPLSCAAALAALTAIEEEDLPGQAAKKGEYLMDKLHEINSPLIREIRGKGLMVGIELRHKGV